MGSVIRFNEFRNFWIMNVVRSSFWKDTIFWRSLQKILRKFLQKWENFEVDLHGFENYTTKPPCKKLNNPTIKFVSINQDSRTANHLSFTLICNPLISRLQNVHIFWQKTSGSTISRYSDLLGRQMAQDSASLGHNCGWWTEGGSCLCLRSCRK